MQKKITTIKDMLLLVATGVGVYAGYLFYLFVGSVVKNRNQNKTIDQLIKKNQKRFDEKVKDIDDRFQSAPIEELLEDGEYIQERRKQD